MFSRLAWRYDLVNDVMSFGLHRLWKRQTVEIALAGLDRPRVLDLCCGSGDLCFLAGGWAPQPSSARTSRCRCWPSRGDESFPARAPLPAADGRRGPLRPGRRAGSPFADGSFDAITICYGLRNVADLPRAARRDAPRARAGRPRVVLDFGKPDKRRSRRPLSRLPAHDDARGRLAVPRRSRDLSLHPGVPERFPAQRGVEKLMQDAGFRSCRYENRLLGTMGINVGEVESR